MGFKKLLSTCLLVLGVISAFAQVTTSSMNGVVKDSQGEGLPGATVKATHLPSGTIYGTTTQPDGRYTIPNMRAGGPYKVEVTFIGYAGQTFNDISLKLGVATKLDATLAAGSQQLQEVSISAARGGIINPNNSGTSVSISRQQIENLPTVTRSVQDFARLSAQASTYSSGADGSPLGISFGGQNNRYNQFAIDGAMANDVFGLSASGTNGGQASSNPISIEAIDQIQVVLNPYDVKQSGFAGGGINAITKSGTNDFHGAAYYLFQNQGMVGKSPDAAKTKYGKFNNDIYGIGIGGPIIKNKLFFYVNAERSKRTSPIDFNPADPGATNFTVAELQAIHDYVQNNFQVDLGNFTAQSKTRESTNILARIDWNINNIHRLTLRHSYQDGEDIAGTSRGRTSAYFYNSYYAFPTTTNSTAIELNSQFSNRMSNELRVGLNVVRDKRQYLGDPFPAVTINDPGRTFNIGSDYSSQVNALAQNIWTITDNLTLYRGKHTITVGTSNDIYKMQNDFIQGNFGAYTYDSLAGFLNNLKPFRYQIQYTTADSLVREGIQFNAVQLSLYAQDEWDVASNFRLTYGLRVDMPVFPTKPTENTTFNKDANFAGYNNAKLPKSRLLLAPRIGFNWDVMDNGKTQIRGGIGIFTSRLPFVWISNQYNNTGNLYTTINQSGSGLPSSFRFRYDKNAPFLGQYSAANLVAMGVNFGAARPTNINLTDPDFKFPQTFKTNIAIDQQLPWGVVGTLELNYSKTINNVIWKQLNTKLTGSTTKLGAGDVARPTWTAISPSYDQVLLLTNTNKGYTYNLSVEFQKSMANGLFAKVGYSFGEAYSLNDGTSSTAGSNWRFPPNINGLNELDLGYSKYRMGHRVLAVVSKQFKYGKDKKWGTTVSLFYNGQSGTAFSWVYFNTVDPTGDDKGSSGNNDQLYIPTTTEVSTMRFDPISQTDPVTKQVIYTRSEAEQRTDLEDLIKNDNYLSKHRGEVAEKYKPRTPFENVFDFKLAQIIPIIKSHKIEVTFDVMNVGNLLNPKWGRTYFISNNVATPITFRSYASGVPVFQYDKRRLNNNDGQSNPYYINNFTSRWRGQVGVRYSF